MGPQKRATSNALSQVEETPMNKPAPYVFFALLLAGATAVPVPAQVDTPLKLNPSKMAKLGTIDPRYVSYNVEMVEVTGGRFWKPYKSSTQEGDPKPAPAPDPNQQVGVSSSLYQFRAPIDLSNPRLRKLAAALGPAYIRVSGTWQNSTFFKNDDDPALTQAPEGFKGVLTRSQWKGVVDFARAIDDRIVTSVAISIGTRNAQGAWTPAQATALFDYTKSIGGNIAATEFMNEPTFPGPGGAPPSYDAAAFANDAKVFAAFLRKESPQTIFLGPGGIGEGVALAPGGMKLKLIGTEDILKLAGPIFDAFSYHFYGTVSRRCMGNMSVDQALKPEWLDRTNTALAFYSQLRDKYVPAKPMWLTETAEAACGGDQFAGEFIDTFRCLNQLGTLAQKGVQVVMHNTLVASDYGLLNEDTLDPRPDFWAALLWKRTMGSVVLNPGVANDPALRVFAHCSVEASGAVTILALNTDTLHGRNIILPKPAKRLTLTSRDLTSTETDLNGNPLKAETDGSVAPLTAVDLPAGEVRLEPASATFFVIPSAENRSCTGVH